MTNKRQRLSTRAAILTEVAFLEAANGKGSKRGSHRKLVIERSKGFLKDHGIPRPNFPHGCLDWNDYAKLHGARKNVQGDHEYMELTAKGHRRRRRLCRAAEEKGFLP